MKSSTILFNKNKEDFTFKDDLYEANEGYVFKNKFNDYICSIMKLANTDSIENYEVIEEPVEEVESEPTYEELLEMYRKENI